MTDRIRVTLTNLEPGPRGLETGAGPLLIDPGAAASLELDEGELEAAMGSGWFAVDAADAAPQPRKRAR